ncbi:MAG: hypothetical protein WCX08_05670 [Candidatus Buchananbacteria bacterium]
MAGFINKIHNKFLALGAIIAIIVIALVGVDYYQKTAQTDGLSDSELLKTPKENIIDYTIKQDTAAAGLKSPAQGIVIYHYVSNQEVPAANYQGLQEDLSKRTPNSQAFLKSVERIDDKRVKKEYVGRFYSADSFQKSGEKWFQIETATTTPVAFARQTKLTLLDRAKEFIGQPVFAATYYSGAGDGFVGYFTYTDNYSWIEAHSAAIGTAADPTGTLITATAGNGIHGAAIRRAFFPFDTSALPDDSIISSASLNLNFNTNSLKADSYGFITIVQTTQDSNTTLSTSDYSKCGAETNPTEGIDVVNRLFSAGITVDQYSIIPLNATGMSWISKTDYTKLGVRQGEDVLNYGLGGLITGVNIYSSEQTGTSQDPYLDVTYTIITNAVKIDGGTIKLDGGTIKID